MTTISNLIAAAATTTATLTTPGSQTADIQLTSAARLLATADDDRSTLRLFATPQTSDWTVTLESAGRRSHILQAGPLRYRIAADGGPEVIRLCTITACTKASIDSSSILTRVCREHLDAPIAGSLPLAGDDTGAHDIASAQTDSRRIRLAALDSAITEAERVTAGDRNSYSQLATQS
jgi:hypothetical protein